MTGEKIQKKLESTQKSGGRISYVNFTILSSPYWALLKNVFKIIAILALMHKSYQQQSLAHS